MKYLFFISFFLFGCSSNEPKKTEMIFDYSKVEREKAEANRNGFVVPYEYRKI